MTPARPAPILPLALILTVLLTAWWVALAWADLGALRLPSADAMIRLAQLRDWIGGQGFADPVQARLGPPGGTAMALSRLPELVPALIIRLLSPLMGVTRAEIAASVFWPELLFFLHLLLAGALARRLGGAATAAPAVALAAIAFPAIAAFLPGRIDAEGLQIVLVEAMMLGLVGERLVLAGAAAAASLLVGIESAPVIAAGMLGLGWSWIADKRPVAGFGLGLIVCSLVGMVALRPEVWPADRCDAFTPPVLALMLMAGGGWLVLAGLAPRLPDRRWRIAAAGAIAALLLAVAWIVAPACFAASHDAGERIWLDDGLMRRSVGALIGLFGLPLMGLGAAMLFAVRDVDRRSRWLLLAVAIAAAVAEALAGLRSLGFAAALAAPVLAVLVHAMRGRGMAWQVGTWLFSAGLVWQTFGSFLEPAHAEQAGCTDKQTLAALDRLDFGTFAAPMELGAYLLGGTQHRSLGGPFSRDGRGNAALADFFRSAPEEAHYQASLWTIDYVALCPSPTGGLPPGLLRPAGLAAQLLGGGAPDWLEPVSLIGSDTLVWRVRGIAGPRPRP